MVARTSTTVFDVVLSNSLTARQAGKPSATATGAVPVRAASFDNAILGAAKAAGTFNPATVAESTTMQGQPNTVTFTLKPSQAIPAQAVVTVSGLTGTQTTGTNVEMVLNGVGGLVFGGTGSWTQSTGTLLLTVAAGQVMPSDANTIFSIVLTNAKAAQTAVSPSIRSGGWVPIAPTTASPAILGAAKANPCDTNNGDCTNTCSIVNDKATCSPCGKGYVGDAKKSGSGCSEVFTLTLGYTPKTYNQTKFLCDLAALLTAQGAPVTCNDFQVQGQPVFS